MHQLYIYINNYIKNVIKFVIVVIICDLNPKINCKLIHSKCIYEKVIFGAKGPTILEFNDANNTYECDLTLNLLEL